MFKKILIANRGEIALRVQRARCREMGIKSVVVLPKPTARPSTSSLLTRRSASVRPLRRRATLSMPAIISAAEVTDAEAIHPGYGFPVRERRLRRARRAERFQVHRPDARADPHHGRQGLGQAGHDPRRRALRAGLGGRAARGSGRDQAHRQGYRLSR